MLQLVSTQSIRVGTHEDIFDTLNDPQVEAAILRGAWSPDHLALATRVAARVGQDHPHCSHYIKWRGVPPGNDVARQSFRDRQACFARLLQTLARGLGVTGPVADASRLEPANFYQDSWHEDGSHLTLIGVPAGETTLFKTSGRDADISDHGDDIASLPQDAVMMFKGRELDFGMAALLHRRPVLTIPHPRVVMQMGV